MKNYSFLTVIAALLFMSSCNTSKMAYKDNYESDEVYFQEGDPDSPYVYAEDAVVIEDNFIEDDYYSETYQEYDDGGDTFITNNYYGANGGFNNGFYNNYYPFAPSGWSIGWNSFYGWNAGWGYGWGNNWGYGGWNRPWGFNGWNRPFCGWGNPYYAWGNPYYGWGNPYYGWGNSGFYGDYYGGGYAQFGTYQPISSGTIINPSIGSNGVMQSAQLRQQPETFRQDPKPSRDEVSMVADKDVTVTKDRDAISKDKATDITAKDRPNSDLAAGITNDNSSQKGPRIITGKDDVFADLNNGRINVGETSILGRDKPQSSINNTSSGNTQSSRDINFGSQNNNSTNTGRTNNNPVNTGKTNTNPRNNYYNNTRTNNKGSNNNSGYSKPNNNSSGSKYSGKRPSGNYNSGNNSSNKGSNSSGRKFNTNSGKSSGSSSGRSSGSSGGRSSSSGRSSSGGSKSSSSRSGGRK